MKMAQKEPQEPTTKIIEDAILTGILKAMGCDYAPMRDRSTGKVTFQISGNVEEALERIYKNEPCRALDALQAIKAARQAIFSLKGDGHEVRNGNFNR